MDRTVKLWDLSAGMQIATSRLQPCAVRALALDQDMLVCSASKVLLALDVCIYSRTAHVARCLTDAGHTLWSITDSALSPCWSMIFGVVCNLN